MLAPAAGFAAALLLTAQTTITTTRESLSASGDSAAVRVPRSILAVAPIAASGVTVRSYQRIDGSLRNERIDTREGPELGITGLNLKALDSAVLRMLRSIPVYSVVGWAALRSAPDPSLASDRRKLDVSAARSLGRSAGVQLVLLPWLDSILDVIEGDQKQEVFSSNVITVAVRAELVDVETGDVIWSGAGRGRARAGRNANSSTAAEAALRSCVDGLVDYANRSHGLNVPVHPRYRAKSPTQAVLLSIAPSLGQFYADDPVSAKDTLIMLGAGAGAFLLTDHRKEWVRNVSWVVVGSAAFIYIKSFFDACSSARRYNAEMGFVSVSSGADDTAVVWRIGLRLRS